MQLPRIGTVKPAAALQNDKKGLSDRLLVKKRVGIIWNFLDYEILILNGLFLRNAENGYI